MNNRYQEISAQAATNVENRVGLGSCELDTFLVEYTKLIVQECASLDDQKLDTILSHFGID